MDHIPEQLARIAERLQADEDFAMRMGEDARAVMESEGVPDQVIAAVLREAEAEVVGFSLSHEQVEASVARMAEAAASVASRDWVSWKGWDSWQW